MYGIDFVHRLAETLGQTAGKETRRQLLRLVKVTHCLPDDLAIAAIPPAVKFDKKIVRGQDLSHPDRVYCLLFANAA